VVGFDNIPLAVIFKPELTTISQPLLRMGQIAARTIIDQIEKSAEYKPEIVIEPELIQRASTGRVKKNTVPPKAEV
jgi:LacI family transcriptional regulator